MFRPIPQHFGIYGILSEPHLGYERLAAVLIEKEVQFIQLRMKRASTEELLRMAQTLRALIPPSIYFIIDDDVSITKAVGADGVHLGQEDMSYAEARQILGPEAIIGLSTHNPEQTSRACALGPSYIGVGPVYPTPTKQNPDPVIGISGMQEMLSLATVPAVVLGGIDFSNVQEVLRGGGRNIAPVRLINQSTDPGEVIDRLKDFIAEAQECFFISKVKRKEP